MSQNDNINEAFQQIFKLKTWEDFFTRTPCVRSSFLWGLGCSSLMAAHKLRLYRGNLSHAFRASILTFSLVSSINFMVCAHDVNSKHEAIRQAFRQANVLEDIPANRKPSPDDDKI